MIRAFGKVERRAVNIEDPSKPCRPEDEVDCTASVPELVKSVSQCDGGHCSGHLIIRTSMRSRLAGDARHAWQIRPFMESVVKRDLCAMWQRRVASAVPGLGGL